MSEIFRDTWDVTSHISSKGLLHIFSTKEVAARKKVEKKGAQTK